MAERAPKLPAKAVRALRRQLRQPSGFHFALADRIGLLDGAAWDALVAGRSWFFSREYLAMLESVPPATLDCRYALIADERGPVAALVMQWAEFDGTAMQPLAPGLKEDASPLQAWAAKLAHKSLRAVAGTVKERMLVAGNLLSYGQHALAVAEDVDPAAVWPAVAEALYRVRRAEKLAGQAGFVIIKDLGPEDTAQVGALQHLSYRALDTEPNMVLAIEPGWKTFDGYLASMASKYRSALKNQVLKPIDAAGLQLRSFEATPELAPRMHELYLQVHKNASVRPFTLHPDYFPALQRAAGQRMVNSGLFDSSGRLVGFITNLLDGEQAVGYHIGFDRQVAQTAPLYLRLLNASVAQAIAFGAKELSLGRTALEPKARLGAQGRPIQVWVRHRQPLFNKVAKRMLNLVHHEDAPDRNPFKAAAGKEAG
jgi:hypothetical protein